MSERLSSSAITTEYANADPIYQAKTAVWPPPISLSLQLLTLDQALPQKYAQYRTCRGDGLCGWRGMPSAPLLRTRQAC